MKGIPSCCKKHFDSDDKLAGFDCLVNFPVERNLLVFVQSNRDEQYLSPLWSKWIPANLSKFSKRELLLLLREYFKRDFAAQSLIDALLKSEPDLLLEAIRAFTAFNSEVHRSTLDVLKNSSDPPARFHHAAFTALVKEERERHALVKEAQKALSDADPVAIIVHAVLWLETTIAQEPQDDNGARMIAVGLFLESQFSGSENPMDSSASAIEKACQDLLDPSTDALWDNVCLTLKLWLDWYNWKVRFWDSYCWDKNYLPTVEDRKVLFSPVSVKAHSIWKRKGQFYPALKASYQHKGKRAFRRQNISSDVFEWSEFYAMRAYAEDLHLSTYNGAMVTDIIRAIEWTRQTSYEWAYNFKEGLVRADKALGQIVDMANKGMLPVLAFSSNDVELRDVEAGCSGVAMDAVSSHVGRYFNRFIPRVNMHSYPVLKWGTQYVLIKSIAGRHEGVFSLPEATLSKNIVNDANKEIALMEESVATKLAALSETTPLFGKGFWPDSGNGRGDVDVAWKYADHLYVFQLKRSMLRLNLKDAYYERLESLGKALDQINKAMVTIRDKPETIPFFQEEGNASLKVIPMVLHTSFECSSENVDGISVINYFSLLEEIEHAKSGEDIHCWLQARIVDPLPMRDMPDAVERSERDRLTFKLRLPDDY